MRRVIVSFLLPSSYTLLMGSPRFCMVVPVRPSYSSSGVSQSRMLSFSSYVPLRVMVVCCCVIVSCFVSPSGARTLMFFPVRMVSPVSSVMTRSIVYVLILLRLRSRSVPPGARVMLSATSFS